jgi:hypothetical protein
MFPHRSLGFPSLPTLRCDCGHDAVAAANRRPPDAFLFVGLITNSLQTGFRIQRIVLLGRDFCGLKHPLSSTRGLMKTGYLQASLSSN